MKNIEIDRFNILLLEKGSDLTVLMCQASDGDVCATATVNRTSKNIAFKSQTPTSPAPTNATELDEDAVAFQQYFSRGLTGGSTPEAIILDAAFTYVLNVQAAPYDEPAVESEDYEIILSARSDLMLDPTADDGSQSAPSGSRSTTKKPKRRKNTINVWI